MRVEAAAVPPKLWYVVVGAVAKCYTKDEF